MEKLSKSRNKEYGHFQQGVLEGGEGERMALPRVEWAYTVPAYAALPLFCALTKTVSYVGQDQVCARLHSFYLIGLFNVFVCVLEMEQLM